MRFCYSALCYCLCLTAIKICGTCELTITSCVHLCKRTEVILGTALENMLVSATICWKIVFFYWKLFEHCNFSCFTPGCSSNGLQLTWPETRTRQYRGDTKKYHNSFLYREKTKQTKTLPPKQNPKNFSCITSFCGCGKRLLPVTLKCLFFHWYQGINHA